MRGNPISYSDSLGLIPPGADPECFRRGECVCATPACSAGLPPPDPPRAPDFVNVQVDAYVFSFWGAFSRDGDSFAGCGFNKTFPSILNLSASFTGGWLNRSAILPGETNNFLNGFAGSTNAAYLGLGGGIVSSPGNGNAIIFGFGGGYILGPPTKIGGGFGSGQSYNQGYTGIKW